MARKPILGREIPLAGFCTTTQHLEKGYINISPIFVSQKKKPSDFTKSKRFKKTVSDFAKARQCKETTVCHVVEGGPRINQGTWLHPKFIPRFCTILPKWVPKEVHVALVDAAVDHNNGKLKDLLPKKEPELFDIIATDKPAEEKKPQVFIPILVPPVESKKASTDVTLSKKEFDALKAKADAYDAIMGSGGTFSLMDVSKMIGIKNLGRVNLRKWMTDKGIVYDDAGRVIAYQEYINKGWCKCFARMYTVEKHATRKPYTVTRYTMKGVVGIFNLLKQAEVIPKDAELDTNVSDSIAE